MIKLLALFIALFGYASITYSGFEEGFGVGHLIAYTIIIAFTILGIIGRNKW